MTTMTEGGVTTTYTYDDWGRTISKADGTHSVPHGWRFGDKLRTYASTFPGEADVNFQYDGLGKRRMKLTNPSAPTDADRTWYRWDAGWNMIGEYAAGTDTGTTWDVGALTRWYQGKAAHADGDPDSTAYNYYAHDHLGSPRTTYSQGQAVLARIEFTPYGSPMTTTGQDMDLGYTGHKWDQETGSFYAPYRYYSPATARWASRDPLGMVDGPNVYGYVRNQPIEYADSSGLAIFLPAIPIAVPVALLAAIAAKGACGAAVGVHALLDFPNRREQHTDDYAHCVTGCRISEKCGADTAVAFDYAWETLQNDPNDSETDSRSTLSEIGPDPCKRSCEDRCHHLGGPI